MTSELFDLFAKNIFTRNMWFKSPMNLNNRINETNRYNLYIKQPRNFISRITEEKTLSQKFFSPFHIFMNSSGYKLWTILFFYSFLLILRISPYSVRMRENTDQKKEVVACKNIYHSNTCFCFGKRNCSKLSVLTIMFLNYRKFFLGKV